MHVINSTIAILNVWSINHVFFILKNEQTKNAWKKVALPVLFILFGGVIFGKEKPPICSYSGKIICSLVHSKMGNY